MIRDAFSVKNLRVAPLKSSVALGLWAMSTEIDLNTQPGPVGTDYVFAAEVVESRDKAERYNVKLTLHSESRNLRDSVMCLDSSPQNKESFKDLPLNTALTLLDLLCEEESNVRTHFHGERGLFHFKKNMPHIKFPFVTASDPVMRSFSCEEDDAGILEFNKMDDEIAFMEIDVKKFLENNTELCSSAKRNLESFARANKNEAYIYPCRFVSLCVDTFEPDYISPAFQAKKFKDQIWKTPILGKIVGSDRDKIPPTYPMLPQKYAHYVVGLGSMQLVNVDAGPTRMIQYNQDMNDIVIHEYMKSNKHHVGKSFKNNFLPDIHKGTLFNWDETAIKNITTVKKDGKGESPYGANNLLFGN